MDGVLGPLAMFPLGDEARTRLTPYVNWSLILVSILVFLWQTSFGERHFAYTLYAYGLIPARVEAGIGYHTLVTNIFLHGGWMHLIGNMLFLYIFGDNIEDAYGHLGYLLFYLSSGVAASLFWMLTALGDRYPAVGASGAISGVLGAYFTLYPEARIRTLIRLGFFWQVVRVSAYIWIGLWFLYQLILALLPINTGVAYWAHIGGFIFGLLIAKAFPPKRRLLSREEYYYY